MTALCREESGAIGGGASNTLAPLHACNCGAPDHWRGPMIHRPDCPAGNIGRGRGQHGGARTASTPRSGQRHTPAAVTPGSHHDRAPGAWMPLAPVPVRGTLPTLDDYERTMR